MFDHNRIIKVEHGFLYTEAATYGKILMEAIDKHTNDPNSTINVDFLWEMMGELCDAIRKED